MLEGKQHRVSIRRTTARGRDKRLVSPNAFRHAVREADVGGTGEEAIGDEVARTLPVLPLVHCLENVLDRGHYSSPNTCATRRRPACTAGGIFPNAADPTNCCHSPSRVGPVASVRAACSSTAVARRRAPASTRHAQGGV